MTKNNDALFDSRNASADTALAQLRHWEVTNLIISGANGGSCVQGAIRGALENKFSVTAMTHAIINFNYTEFRTPYHYGDIFRQSPSPAVFSEIDKIEDVVDVIRPLTLTAP